MNTRYLKILAILFTAVFSFSACGDDDEDEGTDEDSTTGLTITGADWKFNDFRYYDYTDYDDEIGFEASIRGASGEIEFYLDWDCYRDDAAKGNLMPIYEDDDRPDFAAYNYRSPNNQSGTGYEVVSGSITTTGNIKNESDIIVRFHNLKIRNKYYDSGESDEAGFPRTVTLNGSIVFKYDDRWH